MDNNNQYPYGFLPQQEEDEYRQFPGGGPQGFPGGQFPGGGATGGQFPGGFPGGGFPGGGATGGQFPGGGHGGQFPGGGGDQYGPPQGPPPSVVPHESPSAFAVDPGGIRRCRFRYTYIWLNNGSSFWFYPTYVGPTSVAGWRWRRFRWSYYGTDLRRIRSFTCF